MILIAANASVVTEGWDGRRWLGFNELPNRPIATYRCHWRTHPRPDLPVTLDDGEGGVTRTWYYEVFVERGGLMEGKVHHTVEDAVLAARAGLKERRAVAARKVDGFERGRSVVKFDVDQLAAGRVVACEEDMRGRTGFGRVGETSIADAWRGGRRDLLTLHEERRWDESTTCSGCDGWHR